MNYTDRNRLNALAHTYDLNYRLTRLYQVYLEHYPELIRPEMVNTILEEGGLTSLDAVCAILCEAFGLDDDRNADDLALVRDYIRPSVRILDPERYENNPYYKNIKIEPMKDGAWELKWESYPAFRGVIAGDMMLYPDFREVPPLGFFEREFKFPAVLEGGNEWMTLTPVDLDTVAEAIDKARGKVITFGLGLGYFAYMASEKEEVESVTVIEKSESVVRLFNKYILPQFKNREKIRIIIDDAFRYAEKEMPSEGYDFAFVDTWRDASDGAPMYKKMKALEHLSPSTEFSYWIENFLISRLRSQKFEELYDKTKNDADDAPRTFNELVEELKHYGRNI